MKRYIKQAYDKAILINNNGCEYEFYTRIDRRPTKIVMALNDETLVRALEKGRKYMEQTDVDELWELINKDKKPFWIGKNDVIRNWEAERKEAVARRWVRPHEVNKFIAEEKANHKQDIKDSLAGAYHKEPVRTVKDVY